MCLRHPVVLNGVSSDVIGVTSNYSADMLYSTVKATLHSLTTCIFKAENSERFYDPPGITERQIQRGINMERKCKNGNSAVNLAS